MEKFITKHTPGPWRWEVHKEAKDIKLCGGVPRYDLTVLDVVRWGMSGAQIRLREPEKEGLNIMRNTVHWAKAFAGREHHAHWCSGIVHPDAQLIEAAPLLLSALIKAVECEESEYADLRASWYHEAKAAIAAAGVVVEEIK